MNVSLSDVFGQDIFNVVSLTQAIIKLPSKPSKLGDMGIFASNPVNTTTAIVEELQGVLQLVQTTPRGTRGLESKHPKRKQKAFVIPHIAKEDAVKADDVLGLRAFGESTLSLESVVNKVNDRLQRIKDSIDLTKEHMRIGAIQGLIKDADGTTLLDLFDAFGLTRDSFQFNFSKTQALLGANDDVKVTAQKVCRKMQKNLGGTPYTGIQAICGDDFWDAFIQAESVKEAYRNYASNTMLQQQQRNGFMFADIYWMNYTSWFGDTNAVPTGEAQFFPLGVGDIMQEVLAPADTMAAVGTLGLPYYSQQEVMPFDKGVVFEGQSNPLYMVSRPSVLIQGTFFVND